MAIYFWIVLADVCFVWTTLVLFVSTGLQLTTLVLFVSTGLQLTLSILVLLAPFLFPSSPPSWFFTPGSSVSRCLYRLLRWTRIVPIPCAASVVSSSKSLCSSARDHGRLVKQSGLFSSGFHFWKWLRRSKSSFLETYTLWCICGNPICWVSDLFGSLHFLNPLLQILLPPHLFLFVWKICFVSSLLVFFFSLKSVWWVSDLFGIFHFLNLHLQIRVPTRLLVF